MQPQIILITGASSGFGKITAQMLSEQGHIVYGTSRKPSENIGKVRMLVVDVTDSISVRQAVEQIITEQGRMDVLINNAGMGIGGALELATEEEVSMQMNTNSLAWSICAKRCSLICVRHVGERLSISVPLVE